MNESEISPKQMLTNQRLSSSALLGVDVISLVQLTSISSLSTPVLVAIFCFAVSVPFLSGALFGLVYERESDVDFRTTGHSILFHVGTILSVGGIAAIFFHFHYAAAAVFIISIVATVVCFGNHLIARGHWKPGNKVAP